MSNHCPKAGHFMKVIRPHDADARKHRRPSQFCDQHQALNRSLPFSGVRFFLQQRHDVGRGVFQRAERLALRRRDRIVEGAGSGALNSPSHIPAYRDQKGLFDRTKRPFVCAVVLSSGPCWWRFRCSSSTSRMISRDRSESIMIISR